MDMDISVVGVAASAMTFFAVRAFLRSKLRVWASGPRLYRLTKADTPCPESMSAFWYFVMGDAVNFFMGGKEAGVVHKHYGTVARRKCGSASAIASFTFGPNVELLVTNPVDVRYALLDAAADFEKDESITFLSPMLGNKGLIVLIDEEEHTKQLRNVAHAFSPLAVKSIAATTMREHLMAYVDGLRRHSAAEMGDVPAAMGQLSLAIIADAAFGVERESRMLDRIHREFRFTPSALMLLGPALYNSLPLPRFTAFRSIREHIRATFTRAIDDKAATATTAASGENVSQHRRIIDLLAANQGISKDEILDHACTFAFAAHDTTSSALSWLLYSLATHPAVQDKLAVELSDLFVTGVPAPPEAINDHAPYLRACVDESLRFNTVVSSIQRKPKRDVVLPGSDTYVAKGTMLQIPLTFLHRDETVWGPDAETFRPERWTEDAGLKQRVQPCSFMPFAVGKRGCIGKDFAMQELLLGAAMLVRNFVFEWPEGQPEPFREQRAVVEAKDPFKLRLRLRND